MQLKQNSTPYRPLSTLLVSAFFAASIATNAHAQAFDVSFEQCTEYVGIGLVPTAHVHPYVPDGYELSEFSGETPLVLRIAECDAVSVDGKRARPTRTSQVGAMLQGPDDSADINNYTLWFATDNGQLHGALQSAGVDSQLDAQLAYSFVASSGDLDAYVSPAQGPELLVSGSAATPPATPLIPFVASWWADGNAGTVQMRSTFPELRFGSAAASLQVEAGSELATIIGTTTMTFAVLDSYNLFDSAYMEVR